MRVMCGVVLSLVVASSVASGQSLEVHGSAGPTLNDAGNSLAAGIGFSPTSHLTVLVGVERTHLSSRFTSDGRGTSSAFRGGTLTYASAELRAMLFSRDRVSPYLLGGVGLGISRPNVNEIFPDHITNKVSALFVGGGLHVPVREQVSVFADARIVLGAEAGELLAIAPIRAGVAWRF